MEENRKTFFWKNILPEIGMMILTGVGIYAYSIFADKSMDVMLRNIVMMAIGFAMVGFILRSEYLDGTLAYNNSRHLMRFWAVTFISLIIAFICVFLPSGAWPFLAVFVFLSLYSSLSMGVLTASVLLMLPVLLCESQAGVFFLYFVSGIFSASLFRNLKREFKIGIPWVLSMMCLLVCETANIVLLANERLSLEIFVVPVVNLIISSILLIGLLNYFSREVIYQYRDRYLERNDTENPILAEYKKTNKSEYFLCVHTAYFCERIARKLSLDVDALKCAGYYHKLYGKLKEQENAFLFPPGAEAILKEYQERKNAVSQKETAVLICSNAIVSAITLMVAKKENTSLDYNTVIDAVFKKFQDTGIFQNCNITLQELNAMQRIFKEEKLYYDFLR